jgi:hypothetical protein
MWMLSAGLPRQQCLERLGRTILLRENATLNWIFGSVDVISEFPEELKELEIYTTQVVEASKALCLHHLHLWSPTSSGVAPQHTTVLDEQDAELPDLGPLSMEEPILTRELSLGFLASYQG